MHYFLLQENSGRAVLALESGCFEKKGGGGSNIVSQNSIFIISYVISCTLVIYHRKLDRSHD